MERGLVMVMHSVILAVLVYLLMVYVFRQSPRVAEERSVLLGALILAYMVLFGHGMPTKINKRLF
jgi:TRAP-type C4-dicarboxylate transport system permease small subunit